MYQDYLNAIINYYRSEKKSGQLGQRLISPTPGGIKDECVTVFETRFDRKDIRILQTFFNVESDLEGMLRKISRCHTDRFRPLANFLADKTKATENVNIELLAWLIDFPRRPYKEDEWRRNVDVIEELKGREENFIEPRETDAEGSEARIRRKKLRSLPDLRVLFKTHRKRTFAALSVLILGSAGLYLAGINKPEAVGVNKMMQQCMTWVGDHYERASCEPKFGDTIVVALDKQRLDHFKKITRPDTITLASEGKVWYIKRGGQIEYYTAGGRHPIDQTRVLRPLSRYMILKYHSSSG